MGDVEIEAAGVSEAEFVEGYGQSVVGSDLGEADFGKGGCEEEDEEEKESWNCHFLEERENREQGFKKKYN